MLRIHDLLTTEDSLSTIKSLVAPSSQPIYSLAYVPLTSRDNSSEITTSSSRGLLAMGCGKGYLHIILVSMLGHRQVSTEIVCSRVAQVIGLDCCYVVIFA